jgi:UDP-N-acetylglucosamine 2-epimerase (non-hydrolysing)
LLEPLDFESNLYLQSQCALIITDSGGIQEEAPSFGVPTVVMRDHTERSEGIAAGFATLTGTDTAAIVRTAEHYLADANLQKALICRQNPYGDGLASKRILAALLQQPVESFDA